MFKLLLESYRCGYHENLKCHNLKHKFTNKSKNLSYSLGECKKELCPLLDGGKYSEELDNELQNIKKRGGNYGLDWP